MSYPTTGPLIQVKYQNRQTGERTAELRANLYIEGDLDVQGEITKNGEPLESGGSLPYKIYTALLSQSGTNAPVATVLQNTIGDITWARLGGGRYTATSDGKFTANKSVVLVTGNIAGTACSFFAYLFNDTSVMRLNTYDDSFSAFDDRMTGTSIEIRVYP